MMLFDVTPNTLKITEIPVNWDFLKSVTSISILQMTLLYFFQNHIEKHFIEG